MHSNQSGTECTHVTAPLWVLLVLLPVWAQAVVILVRWAWPTSPYRTTACRGWRMKRGGCRGVCAVPGVAAGCRESLSILDERSGAAWGSLTSRGPDTMSRIFWGKMNLRCCRGITETSGGPAMMWSRRRPYQSSPGTPAAPASPAPYPCDETPRDRRAQARIPCRQ